MDEAAVRNLYETLARIISAREDVDIRVISIVKKADTKTPPRYDLKSLPKRWYNPVAGWIARYG